MREKRQDNFQCTIKKPVEIEGIGLHSGEVSRVKFLPAPPDTGVVFVRTDLPGNPSIKADVKNAHHLQRSTTLEKNGVKICVVEHLLAAIGGLGIDNLIIEINKEEPPVMDGSALPYVEVLKKAGKEIQSKEREIFSPTSILCYGEGDSYILLIPSKKMRISYLLEFTHPWLGSLEAEFPLDEETFVKEIAPARTFGFLEEIQPLREKGLLKGGSLENAVVISQEGILNKNLRFPDEMVRHKILDIIGDFFLSGKRMNNVYIRGVRSGHSLNLKMANSIKKGGNMEKSFGLEEIKKILPHRYPFLFIDRMLHMGEKRAVGIKNLTGNEDFFQGHFPHYPIMPAVIMLEAMAQVAGVLLLSKSQNRGKIAYLAGVENARFRRPVVPGDQLVMEVEVVRLKTRTGKVKAWSHVEGHRVAEAEFLFTLSER